MASWQASDGFRWGVVVRFEDALKVVLRFEGGRVNNPLDPGGDTNCGIASASHPEIDLDSIDCNSPKVAEFYRNNYWDTLKLDQFPGKLQLIIFDCAVNQGQGFALECLQESLGVHVDGQIGPETRQAWNQADQSKVLQKYAMNRLMRYQKHKQWDTFGKGWTRRLLEVSLISSG